MKAKCSLTIATLTTLSVMAFSELNAAAKEDDVAPLIAQTISDLGRQLAIGQKLIGTKRDKWIKGTAEQIGLLSEILYEEKDNLIPLNAQFTNDLYNVLISKPNSVHHAFFDSFGELNDSDKLNNSVLAGLSQKLEQISRSFKEGRLHE